MRDNINCQQAFKTNILTSTGETVKIVNYVSCKCSQLIYLLQCRLCQLQYVGKSDASFNNRLNNHRKDSGNKNAILASKQ